MGGARQSSIDFDTSESSKIERGTKKEENLLTL